MAERTLRILLLTDGKPGHETQSRGLCQYFRQLGSVEIETVSVQLKAKALARPLLAAAINRDWHDVARKLVSHFYRFSLPAGAFDLVVSAGGDTAFLNIVLAQQLGAKGVFIGSPRRIQPKKFGWLLTLESYGTDNNIVMPLAPVAIDPHVMEQAGQQLRQSLRIGEQRLLAVLIGGDGAGYTFANADWRALAHAINALAETRQARVLLTTSRRTGEQAETILQAELKANCLADAVWYAREPRKIMSAFLGAADAIVVTADSMSMITEAIHARKPVWVVEPQSSRPDVRYRQALEKFADNGWLHQSGLDRSSDVTEYLFHNSKTDRAGPASFWLDVARRITGQ